MSSNTTSQEQERAPLEQRVQEANQLLQSALQTLGSLSKTSSTTPPDADAVKKVADEIIKGSEIVKNNARINDYVYDAWCGIFELVGKTPPENQQPIVDLLLELRKSTVYTDYDPDQPGTPVNVQGDGTLWKDLPTFGWVARDLWNFDANDTRASPSEQQKWANWTAFLAKLTALSTTQTSEGEKPDPLGFSTFALWTLRDAFEEQRPKNANPNTVIRLAALWIEHAGKALKVAAERGVALQGQSGRGGGEFAERGWTGFNTQRWEAWRCEFLAAAEGKSGGSGSSATGIQSAAAPTPAPGSAGEIDEATREVARKAAGLM